MTKITFERLIEAGCTVQQAKEKIAAVVAVHIYDIMKYNGSFDEEKYVGDLSGLV